MIKKLSQKIKSNEFVKNVLTLFTGSAFAQGILFAISPFLTRFYTAEVLGVFFIYSAIIMISSIIATLQYEMAIVLEEDDKMIINILSLSIFVTFLVSCFSFAFIYLFEEIILILLKSQMIKKFIYFLPLSIFLVGSFQSFSYWLNRNKDYKKIAYGKVSKSTSIAIVQLFGALFKNNQFFLIIGLILGQLFSVSLIFYLIFKDLKKDIAFISLKKMLFLAKKYKKIPLFNTSLSGINMLSNQLPLFLLNFFYGANTAAFYGLSNRVVNAPLGLIAQSVSQVFYQKADEIVKTKKNLYAFVKNTYKNLLKVAILPFAISLLITPFFGFIFGEEYSEVGTYTQILLAWMFISFLNLPITYMITVLNKQDEMIYYEIFLLIFRFLALSFGYIFYRNVYMSLFFFSLVGVCFSSFMLFYLLRISKKHTLNIKK